MNQLTLSLQNADKIEQMLIESGGEITPEIELEMAINPKTISDLVDSKHLTLDRLEKSIELYEKKADQFSALASSLKNVKKFIETSIKQFMLENDKQVLAGNDFQFKTVRSKPSVEISDELFLPDEYKKEKVTVTPDKEKILKDLLIGIPIQGCILKESYSLRKQINKGENK